ncbi:MAG: SGNH/GDSL hydrolase family protein [Planctomycetota bacterium]|nr:SGNH/GDSL hydrolase family protein [Planctomycetota bacterium]
MRWPRNLKKKLLISATTLCVAFVIGELVARAIEPGPFSLWDKNPYVHYDDARAYRHRADFEGRWDGTWYQTNSLGLRGGDLALTFAPSELRVACVGDSCTFGKGVLEEHTWPRQLERLMQDEVGSDRRVVVANLGINGYSGVTYRRIFEDLSDQVRPNLVVVGYNLNDFPNAIQAVDEQVFRGRGLRNLLSQGLRDKLGRLALYRLARQTYYHAKRSSDWAKAEAVASKAADLDLESEVWQKQESYLLGIRDLARDEYGARTAVFLFPYESQIFLDSFDTTPIERLKALGAKHKIPVIDLAEVFREYARQEDPPRELFLRGDRYHPNPQGYHLVAKRVLDELNTQGWLKE